MRRHEGRATGEIRLCCADASQASAILTWLTLLREHGKSGPLPAFGGSTNGINHGLPECQRKPLTSPCSWPSAPAANASSASSCRPAASSATEMPSSTWSIARCARAHTG